MPGQHAVLSPSSAERWTKCPASVRLASTIPPGGTSIYAEEGTCAHARAEIEARLAFGMINRAQHTREVNTWRKHWQKRIGLTEEQEEEMALHVDRYVSLLLSKAAEHPATSLLLEQRVPTGVPSCWGTSDAVLVSPVHVEIVDLKYGMGVQVDAVENPQLRLYGVGALEAFGDVIGDTEFVRCTVFQPRLGHVSTETLTADALRAWRDSLLPVAEEALGDDAHFQPGDAQCRWCPASGQCRAQLEWATARDFSVPADTLTNSEIADVLTDLPMIEQWCKAVRELAFSKVYNDKEHVPGFKVVRSAGRRGIPDSEGAIEALLQVGHDLNEISTRKIKGIGELEKLLGKAQFATVLDPYVVKGEGSLSLVPEDDPRSAADPNTDAAKDFME